jgi:hypothetical protein
MRMPSGCGLGRAAGRQHKVCVSTESSQFSLRGVFVCVGRWGGVVLRGALSYWWVVQLLAKAGRAAAVQEG